MSRSIALILWLSLAGFSFGQGQHEHHGEHGHGHEAGAHAHDLQTNDGQKWQMDDHTRSVMATMSNRVAGFSGDAKVLGTALQADLKQLIKGCTMTGDAHNELHKFLVLYMPAVKNLSETGKKEDLEKTKALLKMYPDYFQ